jgi:hypothetical protein
MGFMKPTVSNPPKPTDTRQERGKMVQHPTYLEMGGLTGASKIKKSPGRMRVEKPEKGGPFTKG